MRNPLTCWTGAVAMLGTATVLVSAVALGATLAEAPSAESAPVLPCAARATSTPFTAWKDYAAYFTVDGGTFEDGAPGWTLAGAGIVAGGEPWRVLAPAANASSLRIAAHGSASAPSLCIATAEDSMRVFYRAPAVASSHLKVTIHVTSGVNVADNTYELQGGRAGWALSDRIMLPDIRDSSGRQTVTITFAQIGTAAAWQIDDLEIDPWKSV